MTPATRHLITMNKDKKWHDATSANEVSGSKHSRDGSESNSMNKVRKTHIHILDSLVFSRATEAVGEFKVNRVRAMMQVFTSRGFMEVASIIIDNNSQRTYYPQFLDVSTPGPQKDAIRHIMKIRKKFSFSNFWGPVIEDVLEQTKRTFPELPWLQNDMLAWNGTVIHTTTFVQWKKHRTVKMHSKST